MSTNQSKIEIQKFDGKSFELWKLKMEDMLVDRDLWSVISEKNHASASHEDWEKMNRKASSLIRLCFVDFVLINVSGEKIAKAL